MQSGVPDRRLFTVSKIKREVAGAWTPLTSGSEESSVPQQYFSLFLVSI